MLKPHPRASLPLELILQLAKLVAKTFRKIKAIYHNAKKPQRTKHYVKWLPLLLAAMHRPLTGNTVAKQLKIFFRKNNIQYTTLNRYITASGHPASKFPPLTFYFCNKTAAIQVFNKKDFTGLHWFECFTINQLLEQLLQYNLLSTTVLKNLL